MIQSGKIIGSHFYFVADGTAFTQLAPGTVSRTSKPDASDATWQDLGIGMAGFTPGREEREQFAPTPGRLRRWKIFHTKHKHDWKLDLEELSPIVWQVLFATLALTTGSTQYNPLAAPKLQGWLKVQQYDEGDTAFNTVDQYCVLSVGSEVKFDDNIVKVTMDAKGLHSTLNSGILT